MKLMRWAMCLATFAVAGGAASAEDYVDIQAMQAKLAAQEARLNDLQAKMYGSDGKGEKVVADGLTSLRKNATVTIGGVVAPRYDHYSSKIETRYLAKKVDDKPVMGYVQNPNVKVPAGMTPGRGSMMIENGHLADNRPNAPVNPITGAGERVKVKDRRYAKYDLGDAKLEGKIDVNEYFDAYFKFDMQDGNRARGAGNTQQYWMRWKNICNSGFGVLVGRDSMKWGGTAPYGRWDTWDKNINDGGMFGATNPYLADSYANRGMSVANGLPNRPTIYADSRTMQITPYWENKDGSFKWEVSFFQVPEMEYDREAVFNEVYSVDANGEPLYVSSYDKYRGINDGVGSFSSRITWKPAFVEGLTVRASVMNLHANSWGGVRNDYGDNTSGLWNYYKGNGWDENNWVKTSRNNFATNIGFEYRPCFFNRVNVYGTWTHGWDDGWVKDQDSDTISFGMGIDVLKNLTVYGLVDHVTSKSDQATAIGDYYKAKGWAHEVGFKYTLPYGVFFDAGWRHESVKYKDVTGDNHTKFTGDGFFGRVGFSF